MKRSVRFISAATIAAGIHVVLFLLMPKVMLRSKQPDPFPTDSVMITMSSIQASSPATQDKMPRPHEQKLTKKTQKAPEPKKNPEPEPEPKSLDISDTKFLKPTEIKQLQNSLAKKVPLEKLKKKTFKNPIFNETKQLSEPPKKSSEQTAETAQPPSLSDKGTKAETQTPKKIMPEQAESSDDAQLEKSSKKQTAISKKEEKIDIAVPLYKTNPLPKYPTRARRRGFEGSVEISVLVSAKGTVTKLELTESSGYKSLDQQALKTVKKWRFEPGRSNGSVKAMWVKIPITFKLK